MYLPSFEVIQSWLQLHNEWLGPVIAFMALIESLVIIGLVVPGVPIMFALGALAGSGVMDALSMLAWGIAGAVIGDGISFQLGYHFHQRVRYWWPFNKHPAWLKKGEDFFRSHGDMSIALGRFIGPVRPIVPVVAGMLDMPPGRFYTVNVLSAIPWAPIYLMPGFLAGAAIQAHGILPTDFFVLMSILVVFAVIVPALALWLLERYRTVFLCRTMLCVLGVVLTILVVCECAGLFVSYNAKVAAWLEGLHVMPYLKESMYWLTWTGSLGFLLFPVVIWLCWSCYQSAKEKMFVFLIGFAGMEFTYWLLKWLTERPRPSQPSKLDPFSFPSGHTAQVTFLLLWLAIHLSNGLTHVSRLLVLSTAMMMVFLTGLSRLILNVHWLVDVVAGFIIGAGWLVCALYISTPKAIYRKPKTHTVNPD